MKTTISWAKFQILNDARILHDFQDIEDVKSEISRHNECVFVETR